MRLVPTAIAATLIGVGAVAAAAPAFAVRLFGIDTDEPDAFVFARCTGARDAILGALILASMHDPVSLRRTLAWTAPVGLLDATVVAGARGLRPILVLHVGGALVIAAAALATRA